MLNFLVVDFRAQLIKITAYTPITRKLETIAELALSEVEDCYNLMLETTPLTLAEVVMTVFTKSFGRKKRKLPLARMRPYYFGMAIVSISPNGMKIRTIMKL